METHQKRPSGTGARSFGGAKNKRRSNNKKLGAMGLAKKRRLSCVAPPASVETQCHTVGVGAADRFTAAGSTPAPTATAVALAASATTVVATRGFANSSRSSSKSQMEHKLALGSNLSEMDLIKSSSRTHTWHWNHLDKSHECIVSEDRLEVCFHPECSESAAAIRGSEPLVRNGNYYYWEVTAFDKTYGTSVMFGLCTKEQSLHANDYCNLVGLDKNGWSLSHKGLIWHDGLLSHYTEAFPPNRTVTVGLLFNTRRGELSYFLDGKNLGVAFYGLNDVNSELYPVIGSTAKCTRIRLTGAYCGFESLLERSCSALIRNARDRTELIENMKQMKVPNNLIRYIAEVCGSQTKLTAKSNQYNWNVNNYHNTTFIRQL